MKAIKIYFAQPVDNIPFKDIKENIKRFRELVNDLPIKIVAPYLDKSFNLSSIPLDRRLAQRIVKEDYSALEASDILFADLSQENRQAIGMIFEMAYAASQKKVIVVYTGKSSLNERVWIIAISDYICKTWFEVKNCVRKILD